MFLSKKQISSTTSCGNRSWKSSSFSLHWPSIINSHAVCFSLLISRSSSGHVPNTTFSSSRLSWSSRTPLHESFPLFSSLSLSFFFLEANCLNSDEGCFWILNPFERGHGRSSVPISEHNFLSSGMDGVVANCQPWPVHYSGLLGLLCLIYSQVVQPDDHWRSMSL